MKIKAVNRISSWNNLPEQGASLLIYHADKKDKVLLIQRNLPHLYDHWSIPGGARDPGESFQNCAWREASEEICGGRGILDLLKPYLAWDGERPRWIEFWLYRVPFTNKRRWKVGVLHLKNLVSTDHFEMNHEVKKLDWFRVDQLPTPIDPTTKAAIVLYRCFWNRIYKIKRIFQRNP